MKIIVPNHINKILSLLHSRGHSAYIVGGAVRDALLGFEGNDFDITTSATPGEIKEVLSEYKTLDTGIKHGTVTAVSDKGNVEITTYRIEGVYSDNRRPDGVEFTRSLREDLARRDFTVNALCYNENEGLIDLFFGKDDLTNKTIRTVGEASLRFSEDALRILRGVRFCAQLGFSAEESTKNAMHSLFHLLKNISRERIKTELEKTIISHYAENTLSEFCDIIAFSLGTKKETLCIKGLSLLPPEGDVRFAYILHKEKEAEKIMKNLKCEKQLTEFVSFVSENINFNPESEFELKKFISYHGYSHTKKLALIKKAANIFSNKKFSLLLDKIECEKPCLFLKDLDLEGGELLRMGYNGAQIGKALDFLLEKVMAGEIENSHDKLISALQKSI